MLEYLKNKILEELNDAVDYMSKALETKGHPCSSKFYAISMDETKHAGALTKTFSSIEKPATVTDAEFAKMYKDILDAYTSSMGRFEEMKKLYWK